MIKRIRLIILSSCVLIGLGILLLFMSKAYYPQLPMEGVSKREVYSLLAQSENELIPLIEKDNTQWYGYKGNPLDAKEALKQRMLEAEWTFVEQLGSGYFFTKKDNAQRTVTSQMWTGSYVLFQVHR